MKLRHKYSVFQSLIIFISLLSVFTGCIANKVAFPSDLGISEDLLNKDLELKAPPAWNDSKDTHDLIVLEVSLKTNKQIITTPDFGAEIFYYDEMTNKWKRTENLGNYETPPSEIILEQGDSIILPLLPELSKTPPPNKVLIFVRAKIVEDGKATEQQIGSYIILDLNP